MAVLGLCLLAVTGLAATLRPGDRGQDVLALQDGLARLGYFQASPTGYYGQLTTAAVRGFQSAIGLTTDGVAGERTLAAIQRALQSKQLASRGGGGSVALLPWDTVNQLWGRGTTVRVYDVDTGIGFLARRLYGSLHADVEPLTKHDTYLLSRIYGGRWSWARRAVVVELNGRYVAGSMNGMPHGAQAIYDNNFPGQFCIHFLGSRLHKNRQIDAEHQAMVLKAARVGLLGLVRPAVETTIEETPEESRARAEASTNSLEVE